NATIQLLENAENEESLEQALARVNSDPAPTTGGIWTNSDGATVAGTTVPNTPGVFTYTVSEDGFCSASATVTVLDIPQDCPIVTETTQEFCASISLGSGDNYGKPTIANLEPTN